MVYPNNGLNVYKNPVGVTPGAYTGSAYTASSLGATMVGFDQVMMKQVEHWDPFIQRILIAQPRFWHDRIPRGAFPNFQGFEQETRVFRGGLVKYAGIDEWTAFNPIPSATNDPCGSSSYVTPSYAWERLNWSGFFTRWGSDPICRDMLRFVDQAIQQLAWILEVNAEYGISIQEVWNRDWLLKTSVDRQRSYVMTSSYVGNTTAPKFFYEPRCKFFATTVAFNASTDTYKVDSEATGITAPFIVFPASVDVEPLNFDVLDAVHESLDIRCQGSALGFENGRPIYGLPISALDFERYVKGNTYEWDIWRRGEPDKLIQGYDLGVKSHRGYGILNDSNQLRFKVVKFVADYDPSDYANVGSGDSLIDGQPVFIAQYVPPRIEGRTGENGQKIPEDNPEYYAAELAVMPILMNNIFTNLMGTPLTDLGSGTFFGPHPGLNGQLAWVNIPSENNPEGNKGNFRGKYEIFPRPEANYVNSISFLYRRCSQTIRSRCPVDNAYINPDIATGTVAAAAYSADDGNTLVGESLTLTPTLLKKLADGSVGKAVTLKFTGAGALAAAGGVQGFIIGSSSAPTYTVVLPTALAVAAPGSTGVEGYYVSTDDNQIYYHATNDETTKLVLTSIALA